MGLIVSLPVCLSLYLSLTHGHNISTLYIAAIHDKMYMHIHIGCIHKVKFVMKWRCYNRHLWFEIERNLSPPDAFYGIFYVQNPFAAGAPPRTPLGELTALPQTP